MCAQNGEHVVEQLDMAESELDAVLAFFERIAVEAAGPSILPDNRNHAIHDDPKILQLTCGKYRFAYFYDGPKIIIVCHAYGRHGGKSGKIAKSDIKVAVSNRDSYFAAKNRQDLEFEED